MIYELKFFGVEQEVENRFSKISKEGTIEQQIVRQQKQLKYTNHFREIIGQWPGEESIDDILKDLD